MFKNEYQGGTFFEVFSAQGKDPTAPWKLQGGSGIRKVYEREVKSFVYTLDGTVSTTKMTIPKDMKQAVVLVQRYLVLQLYVAKGAEFTVEIGITDVGNNKRRLHLSTSVKEVNVTPLHAKLPLIVLRKSMWVNCCLDMVNLVSETWRGQTYRTIDSLSISANCKLRRIFTMKNRPGDTTDDEVLYGVTLEQDEIAMIPRQCQMAHDVQQVTQIVNMTKIRCTEIRQRGDRPPPIDLDLSSSGRQSQFKDGFHIAFGTKIGKPPTAVAGRKSSSSALPSHRESMRSSHGLMIRDSSEPTNSTQRSAQYARPTAERLAMSQRSNRQRLSSDPGNIAQDILDSGDSAVNQSRTWSGTEMQEKKLEEGFVKPHPPPPEGVAERGNRRRPKVRSGDKATRTPADAHTVPIKVRHGFTADNQNNHNAVEMLSPSVMSISPRAPLKPLRGRANTSDSSISEIDIQDESVSNVINALKDNAYNHNQYGGDDDESELMDSLNNFKGFNDVGSSSEELFQFRSPPRRASELVHTVESNLAARRTIMLPNNSKPPDDNEEANSREVNKPVPPKQSKNLSVPLNNIMIEGRGVDPRVTEIKQPRPPDSPRRGSPRPGSGRNHSRANSMNSNTSNKPTPDNSGSGNELHDQLHPTNKQSRLHLPANHISGHNRITLPINSTDTSPDSSGSAVDIRNAYKPALSHRSQMASRKIIRDGNNIEGMPSPRNSDKEPRISSAGRRSAQESQSSGSSRSDHIQAVNPTVQYLQAVERNSSSMSSISATSTRVSRKSLREIPQDDQRLANAQYSPTKSHEMNSKGYQPTRYTMVDDAFDEAHMLRFLKREQEYGSIDEAVTVSREEQRRAVPSKRHYEHEVSVSDDEENLSDESFNTTSVPVIGSHNYHEEMLDTLDRSDPRDISLFSPPIVFPSQKNSSSHIDSNDLSTDARMAGRNRLGSDRPIIGTDSSEEELDLLYDPVLNCYYDPHTSKYYELI